MSQLKEDQPVKLLPKKKVPNKKKNMNNQWLRPLWEINQKLEHEGLLAHQRVKLIRFNLTINQKKSILNLLRQL
jgi:hypothetical protein